jgi:hypothetical protein
MKRMVLGVVTVFVLVLASLQTAVAAPLVLAMDCISAGQPTDCAIIESQMTVTVDSPAANKVTLRLDNSGPAASSWTDFYLRDLLGLLTFESFSASAGVSYGVGATPPDLPGWNGFLPTGGFSADSNAPAQPNGVNPGEWLIMTFTGNIADVLAAITTQDLMFGGHIQGFEDGGSVAAVNDPPQAVPEPGTMLLLGTGLVGFLRMRKKKVSV